MSAENVVVVQRVFDASAHRDTETVLSLFDREAEWDNSRGPFKDLIATAFLAGGSPFWTTGRQRHDNRDLKNCRARLATGLRAPSPRGALYMAQLS
jgi:ketosteroid isomerase-like protein